MIKVFPDIEELNRFAAEKFVEIGNQAIKMKRSFAVALAGGSTPKSLYRLLASEKYKNRIDRTKVYFFFGDERNVLPGDEESNFRMADENLFQPLKIEDKNIFRWQTEFEDAKNIAANYETKLMEFFDLNENPPDRKFPRFDLILLGMGADGHTASLFPFTKALHETERLAVINNVEKLNANRLTMTFPVINNAANVMFLVSGAEKAESLREVLRGENNPDEFPSQKVKLNDGNLLWLVDREAARLLQ
ncbi:MAG: 6-phosphogluconolactonase [Pyrinomonadaceae bacterium]